VNRSLEVQELPRVLARCYPQQQFEDSQDPSSGQLPLELPAGPEEAQPRHHQLQGQKTQAHLWDSENDDLESLNQIQAYLRLVLR